MSAQGYAFEFDGHGIFTPEGRANDIAATEAHNQQLEAEELRLWAQAPDSWNVYVVGTVSHVGQRWRPNSCGVRVGDKVTTWLGTVIGTILSASTFQHNFGSRMTCIRVKGTNGATYSGRFGSDWSQLCHVRKVRK